MPRKPRAAQLGMVLVYIMILAACASRVPRAISPTATPNAPAEPSAVLAVVPGQRFAINGRAESDDPVLSKIALEVRTAQVEANTLVLRIALVNMSEERFRLVGSLGGEDARLVDAAGREYAPEQVDATLQTLDPEGGFAPGTANVGNIVFAIPQNSTTYEFRLPRYAPIRFELNTPLADQATVPDGVYPLDGMVRSQRDALQPIALRVRSVEIGTDRVTWTVGFVNVGRQGYNLLVGPNGNDARMIDGEGVQHTPIAASETISTSLAPEGGWQPQQENTGTIVFPRPADLSQLRFVFPEYDAFTVTLGNGGVASTSITSASGGPPAPTATPTAEERATQEIEALLAKQAVALETGEPGAYADSFAPELRDEQQAIAIRLAQVPVVSYTLQLAPGAIVGSGNTLTDVPVELRYELRGIQPGNVFHHDLRVDFIRSNGVWLVTRVDPGANPPFWWLGDVVVRETAHFLIFARPEAQNELATLENETDAAYETLMARGLPLEPRYVAYFAGSNDDFTALTGRGTNYLGVALSRYEFANNTITTTNRAFYINSASFRGEQADSQNQRQTTITHELVHLALANETRPFTPPWLVEGTAVFLSEDTGASMRQRLVENNRLSTLSLEALTQAGSIGKHGATDQRVSDEYAFAGEAVAYLVNQYGEPNVLAFYRSFAEVPADVVNARLPRTNSSSTEDAFAELSVSLTEEAVQGFFGITLAQLDADVKAWLMNR